MHVNAHSQGCCSPGISWLNLGRGRWGSWKAPFVFSYMNNDQLHTSFQTEHGVFSAKTLNSPDSRRMADQTMYPWSVRIDLLDLTWDRRSDFVLCLISPPPWRQVPHISKPISITSLVFLFLIFLFESLHGHEGLLLTLTWQGLNREIRGSCHPSNAWVLRWRTPK